MLQEHFIIFYIHRKLNWLLLKLPVEDWKAGSRLLRFIWDMRVLFMEAVRWLCRLRTDKLRKLIRYLEVLAVTDEEALEAAFRLTGMEGIIPALESAHALAVLEKKTFRPEEVVVVNLSGRGDKDMKTYIEMRKKR